MKNTKIKLLPLLLLSFTLFSCTKSDNSANNRTADDVKLSSASEAYDGYEGCLGKDYGNFSLPEKITVTDFDKIYTLECNTQENQVLQDTIKEIYKEFYGDDYSEDMFTEDEYGGYTYIAGTNSSTYWGLDLTLMGRDYTVWESADNENTLMERYAVDLQGDSTFSVSGNEYSVKDEAEVINQDVNELVSDFYSDFDLAVKDIFVETADDKSRINFSCSQSCEGVPIQYSSSEYFIQTNLGETSYWMSAQLSGVIEGDKLTYLNAGVPYTVLNKTECEGMVPFNEAVEILKNELAENTEFEFTNAELMYCSLAEQPKIDYSENADTEETDKTNEEYLLSSKTFEPYWCFEIKNDTVSKTKRYIKVNALSGEVFVDMN